MPEPPRLTDDSRLSYGENCNDSHNVYQNVQQAVKEVPIDWMNRNLPYTDWMKSLEWQKGFQRFFFIDDHGVFRPLDLERAQAGELTHFKQLSGLPYNVGEILQQFTKLPLSRIHHFATMGKHLHALFSKHCLVDALIHVQDRVFAAHRVVLACHSVYFARAFLSDKLERKKKMAEVRLKNVRPSAFLSVLSFMYSGQLYVNDVTVDDLMHVAHQLEASAVLFRCLDFLGKMPMHRSLEVVGDATPQAVVEQAHKVLTKPLREVSQGQIWLDMTIEPVEMALGQDDIVIDSEMEVLDAAMRWLNHDLKGRKKYLDRLMQQVRFVNMTAIQVIQVAQGHNVIRSSPFCRHRIMESIWLLTLKGYGVEDQLECEISRRRFRLPRSSEQLQESDVPQYGFAAEAVQQYTAGVLYDNLQGPNHQQPFKEPSAAETALQQEISMQSAQQETSFLRPLTSQARLQSKPSTSAQQRTSYRAPSYAEVPVQWKPSTTSEMQQTFAERPITTDASVQLLQHSRTPSVQSEVQQTSLRDAQQSLYKEPSTSKITVQRQPSQRLAEQKHDLHVSRDLTKMASDIESASAARSISTPHYSWPLQETHSNIDLRDSESDPGLYPNFEQNTQGKSVPFVPDMQKAQSAVVASEPPPSVHAEPQPSVHQTPKTSPSMGAAPQPAESQRRSPQSAESQRRSPQSAESQRQSPQSAESQRQSPQPTQSVYQGQQPAVVIEKPSVETVQSTCILSQPQQSEPVTKRSATPESAPSKAALPSGMVSERAPPERAALQPSTSAGKSLQQSQPTEEEDSQSEILVPSFKIYTSRFENDDVKGQVLEVEVDFTQRTDQSSTPSHSDQSKRSHRRKRKSSRSGDRDSSGTDTVDAGGEGSVILAIGGYLHEDSVTGCSHSHRLDEGQDKWEKVSDMPGVRLNFGAAFLKGKLYVMGGYDPYPCVHLTGAHATRDTFRYDPSNEMWECVADMCCARSFHAVGVLAGRLYAMGGQDADEEVLDKAEVYDPGADRWKCVSPMTRCRVGACAGALGDRILVAGGYGKEEYPDDTCPVLSSTEWFTPSNDTWQPGINLRVPRAQANLVTVGSNLYLFGGVTRNLSTGLLCSMRDVDMSDASSGQWTHLTDLQIARHNAGAAALGSKVYVVGGVSTDVDELLRSVECYDTDTNKWDSQLPLLPIVANSVACVVTTCE